MNKKTESVVQEVEQEAGNRELARDAIKYVLGRIAGDPNVRYHMGAFTEAFERLKKAHSALSGISEVDIQKEVLGFPLKRKAAAQILSEIKDILNVHGNGPDALHNIKQLVESY